MRLVKIKLAGFKSFVDPTTIALPGQLVGVVGPNGCGKSNVIDAVRWVLGESRASALRGESMQDVIFNGSGSRKPVGRASVELVFDNSLGRVGGQWGQYAELSVKRVLTRNGGSSYYLNNQQVRRKDVADVFLGTGLGARAYAIIEQGMISRIIEARPEELRVFLEEAAGVTKYKERRKETASRLGDARDNLLRVEDIQHELTAQLARLEAQAAVARQFHALQQERRSAQWMLALVKRDEALREQARVSQALQKEQAALEAEIAALRETEARLEAMRVEHFVAGDKLHAAQGKLYECNAEVVRCEGALKHHVEVTRQRARRREQLASELQRWQAQLAEAEAALAVAESTAMHHAESSLEQAEIVETWQARLPEAEAALAVADVARSGQVAQRQHHDQACRLAQGHLAHLEKQRQSLQWREARLVAESSGWVAPETGAAEAAELQATETAAALEEAEGRVADLQAAQASTEAAHHASRQQLQTCETRLADARARLELLVHQQQRAGSDADRQAWLVRHGLSDAALLWQSMQVDPGWENALEAVLRERLNAVRADAQADVACWGHEAPPKARVTVVTGATVGKAANLQDGLACRVQCRDNALTGVLADWLRGVRTADSIEHALAERDGLAEGECFVTPDGHQIWPYAVAFFTPEAGHGVLERQREIALLEARVLDGEEEERNARLSLDGAQQRLQQAQTALQDGRAQVARLRNGAHAAQVAAVNARQEQARYDERREAHARQQQEIGETLAGLAEEQLQQESQLAEAVAALAQLEAGLQAADAVVFRERQALESLQQALQAAERQLRESEFARRSAQARCEDAQRQSALARQQCERSAAALEELAAEATDENEAGLTADLAGAVELRSQAETALSETRQALDALSQQLRVQEEQRLRLERGLDPLREKIEALRLKAQAAELAAAQMSEQLVDVPQDRLAGLTEAVAGRRASDLQGAVTRLGQQIDDLGAVNLAALEELQAAETRKRYLEAQSADLNEAINTLEDAIRRIDRETRALLQTTFDTVNGHFSTLFPTLFGGGEARLVMTGEEILDSGVQVVAQPPGKRNSSIHLLSGGEKALTAIALVFGMFQLNPAPFCLLDEVDAPLDDTNTERFRDMVKRMSAQTQFLFISHNKITMEAAQQLVGVTMQEQGVSRIVEVDIEEALRLRDAA